LKLILFLTFTLFSGKREGSSLCSDFLNKTETPFEVAQVSAKTKVFYNKKTRLLRKKKKKKKTFSKLD
jgi:hypothetical protein